MSNLPSSPGSRPLEQLKVAELRDELRKRGLSLKGVKKELFERLEETIKREEQYGSAHMEHQEGACKTDPADEPEDSDGEGESLDGGKEESSKIPNDTGSPDTTNMCPSNTSPTSAPVLIDKGTTPFQESQALSVVSAPDGVPGVSEDREGCYTAGNLETNNSVLFVNNAACENGGAVSLPENGLDIEINLANATELGKGTVDVVSDAGHEEVPEGVPMSVMPEVAAKLNVDVLHESSVEHHESSVLFDTGVSDVTLRENHEPHVAVDNEINVMPDDKTVLADDHQSISEALEDKLRETVIQMPTQAFTPSLHPDAVTAQVVNEPFGDLKADDAVKRVSDERDMVVNEDKPSVHLEKRFEKCEASVMVKIDVKVEPMEIETGLEGTSELASQVRQERQELQHFEQDILQDLSDSAQLNVEPDSSDHDNTWKSQGRESVSGTPHAIKEDAKDVVDLKPKEEDSEAQAHLKRSSEPKQQEPAKRMRRWNSGNQAAGDTLKPLTSDTVKEIISPENTDSPSIVAQRVTQKVVATSRLLPPKVKVESEPSSNKQIVPLSTRAPSNSLKIERFVRPFTLKAVKDLLAEFGECTDFWMDQIKTHCFVSYSSVDEAVAARDGLYGRQWPPSVGNFLTADYVDQSEVKLRLEGLTGKPQVAPVAPPPRVSDPVRASLRLTQPQSSFRSDSTSSPPSRFSRGGQFSPVPPEPAVPTLEDLFFKTKAKPHIYYLPLTDEQVAEKLKSRQAFK